MNNSLPSVSVIIPCYNASRFVTRAIASVFHQSVRVAQLICVDDGSEDNTLDVLNNLAAGAPIPLKILTIEHGGSAAARNLGLEYATGQFVQFLDADDELLPLKLELQLSAIADSASRVDLVAGAFLWVHRYRLASFRCPTFLDSWANLISGNLGVTSANLWRRSSVMNAAAWNPEQTSSQEYELMFRMMQNNTGLLLSHQPLTRKFDEPGSMTSGTGKPNERRKNNLLNYVYLRRSIARYLETNDMMDDRRRELFFNTVHARLKQLFPYDPEQAINIHKKTIPEDHCLPGHDGPGVPAMRDLLCAPGSYPSITGEGITPPDEYCLPHTHQ
jgi:glycosyltransferase involved in cell wall biosynthesis